MSDDSSQKTREALEKLKASFPGYSVATLNPGHAQLVLIVDVEPLRELGDHIDGVDDRIHLLMERSFTKTVDERAFLVPTTTKIA